MDMPASRLFLRPSLVAAAAMLGVCGTATLADVVYQNSFDSGVAGDEWSNQKVSTIASPWGTFLGNFGQETVRLTLGRGSGNGSGGGDGGSGGGGKGGGGSPGGSNGVGSAVNGRPVHTARGGWPGLGGSGLLGHGVFYYTGGPGKGGGDGGNGSGGDGGGGGGDPGVVAGSYSLFFDLHLFDTWDGLDRTYGVDRFIVQINGQEYFNEVLETFEPWENRLGGWKIQGNHGYNTNYRDISYEALEIRFDIANAGELLEIDFIGATNQSILDESWGLDNVRVVYNGPGRMIPAAPTAAALLGGLLAGARRRR